MPGNCVAPAATDAKRSRWGVITFRIATSSRGLGVGETSLASASSESVVLPIAETVPTTSRPCRFASTNRFATSLTLSGSATDEPPNFITIVSAAGCAMR
jgi:hypothetical protein